MKKALLFGLSLSLALSLTACGGSNDNAADSSQDTSTPEITQPVDTSTPEVEQTTQPVDTSTPEADPIVEEVNAVTSDKPSDLELYELIYETGAIGLDVTDEVAFEMEKDLAKAYSDASITGEAFYDGYIAWRLENHPLQTTDPAPDTTPSNGGTTSGNTSSSSGSSGSSGGTNTGNSGSNTSGSSGSTGNSGGAWLPDGVTSSAPSEFYNPTEGKTEEEIQKELEETSKWAEESGITFGTGSRSN